jgi:Tol biopolymer transport system component
MVVTRKAVKNENDYYYTNHLYLLDLLSKSEPTQLTFGDKNDSQPQWSSDGKQILFRAYRWRTLSTYGLLPLSGGEAHVITKAEYGSK